MIDKRKKSSLWIERWRPDDIQEMILTNNIRTFLQGCIDKKDIPNILMYGNAGTGKTTLAGVIQNALQADMLYLNGSSREDRGIGNLERITKFVTTYSLSESTCPFKIVFIDEAEKMTKDLQEALKVTIEELSHVARFILNTNNKDAIIDPLQSRFAQGTFNLIPANKEERGQLGTDFKKRLLYILKEEKVEYEDKTLNNLIIQHFPDFRAIIGIIQKYTMVYPNQKLDDKVLNFGKGLTDELVNALKSRNIKELRKLAIDIDANSFFREFDSTMYNLIEETDDNIINATLLLGKYVAESHTDELIILRCCLIALASKIKFKK